MFPPRPSHAQIPLALVGAGLASLFLAACGSFTPAGARPGGIDATIPRMPPDFSVSLSVHPAVNADNASREDTLAQSAWYMVEPDGRLRAAPGTRTARTPLPPIVRQLTHAEVLELWSTVRASGLTPASAGVLGGSAGSARAGAKDLPTQTPEHPTAMVFVAAEGERRSFEINLDGEDAAALGTRDLAARLRQLAAFAPQ